MDVRIFFPISSIFIDKSTCRFLPSTDKIRKDVHAKLLSPDVNPQDRIKHIAPFGRAHSAENIEKIMVELGRPLDKPLPPRENKPAETSEQ